MDVVFSPALHDSKKKIPLDIIKLYFIITSYSCSVLKNRRMGEILLLINVNFSSLGLVEGLERPITVPCKWESCLIKKVFCVFAGCNSTLELVHPGVTSSDHLLLCFPAESLLPVSQPAKGRDPGDREGPVRPPRRQHFKRESRSDASFTPSTAGLIYPLLTRHRASCPPRSGRPGSERRSSSSGPT